MSWKPLTTTSAPMSSSRTFTSRAHYSGRRFDDGGAGWIWSSLSLVSPPETCRSSSTPTYKDASISSRCPGTSKEAYMPATTPRALASETSMVEEPIDSGAAASEICETISNSESPKPVNDSKDSPHRWERCHCESSHPASPSLVAKMSKDDEEELRPATAVVTRDNEPVQSGRGGKQNDTRSKFSGNRRQLTLATLYLNNPLCDSLMSPERIPVRPQMVNNSPVGNRRGFSFNHGCGRSKTTRGDGIDPALACDRSSWGPVLAAEDHENISVSLISRPLVSSLQSPARKARVWRILAPMRPLLRTQVVVASTTRGARSPPTAVTPPGALLAAEKDSDAYARGAEGVDCPEHVGYAVFSPPKGNKIGNSATSVPSNAQRNRAPSRREADSPPTRVSRGSRRSEPSAMPRVPRLRLERLATPVREEESLSSCSIAINPSLN